MRRVPDQFIFSDQISEREVGIVPHIRGYFNPPAHAGGTDFILLLACWDPHYEW